MPQHAPIVDELIKCIDECIQIVRAEPNRYNSGTRATYGMIAKIPDEVIV